MNSLLQEYITLSPVYNGLYTTVNITHIDNAGCDCRVTFNDGTQDVTVVITLFDLIIYINSKT